MVSQVAPQKQICVVLRIDSDFRLTTKRNLKYQVEEQMETNGKYYPF